MRLLQLCTLALLTTAARADNVPFFNYFYSCSSGVEDCTNFQHHTEGPLRTFDIAAQPVNGYFFTSYLANEFPDPWNNPIDWRQISSNHRGEALGLLGSDGHAVLMGPDGQIFPIFFYAQDINESGIIVSGGPHGPFLDDASTIEATGSVNPRILDTIIAPEIFAGVFNGHVSNYVNLFRINDANQALILTDDAYGILSPFAVPEPSALLLLTSVCVSLAICRIARHGRNART